MKKDPLADKVKILHEDYMAARLKWNELYNGDRYWHTPNYFETFIGRETVYKLVPGPGGKAITFLSQRAADKVAMLCSPHARTLMQAFIIRTGYHKKLPK